LLTAVALAVPTTVALPMSSALPTGTDPLPTIVAVLAMTHLAGLLAVAHTALDHRRTS
jgi:hypothetical protein